MSEEGKGKRTPEETEAEALRDFLKASHQIMDRFIKDLTRAYETYLKAVLPERRDKEDKL